MSETHNPVSRWLRRIAPSRPAPVAPPAPDVAPIAACADRSVIEVAGQITGLRPHVQDDRLWLVADLADASGALRLVWMGRAQIDGIEVGRRLRVRGRLTRADERPTVFNPRYELLP